jgi:hypothetical protein
MIYLCRDMDITSSTCLIILGTDDRGLLNLDESNDLTVWATQAFFANPRVIGEHVMVRHCRTISSTKAPYNGVRRDNARTSVPYSITLRLVPGPMSGARIWGRKREFNRGVGSGRGAKLYVAVR